MSTPEYATHQGQRVQVLERFFARPDCRVCGNAPMDEPRECPACGGTGQESRPVEWARVGLLEGPDAGTKRIVRAAAL